MYLQGKHISEVNGEDIELLVSNSVPESISLDYKQELHDLGDEGKKEFLADVSAFANSLGGVLVLGVSEARSESGEQLGYASEIVGLKGLTEKTPEDLEKIIHSGLDPRLDGCIARRVEVNGADVILLGIPRSMLAPHAVWFKKSGKFYMRTNSRKEQMDSSQIKSAFLTSSGWLADAEDFKRNRIEYCCSQEKLPQISQNEKLFVHLVPIGTRRDPVDLKASYEALRKVWISSKVERGEPLYAFNADGICKWISGPPVSCHAQYFRNGSIEYFESRFPYDNPENNRVINGIALEREILDRIVWGRQLQAKLNIVPPVAVFCTLLGMK